MRFVAPLVILALTACDRTDRFDEAPGSDVELEGDAPADEGDGTSTDDQVDPDIEPEWEATYQEGTVVDVNTGRLSGIEDNGLRVFKGVPFAAPPVAGLRLRDPQPAPAWTGTLDASEFGPACPQRTNGLVDTFSQVSETDEDCLTLNIWAKDDGTAKPVMVWFHGGAFFYGAGSQNMYDGAALAEEDVVVVTINYRLGALGFLAHPELGANIGNNGAGNFGLKDQVMALQWVHDNIATFGGDPNNVTMFGESAGGISTCVLATTDAARPLVHKMIGQSPVGCNDLPTADRPSAMGGQSAHAYAESAVATLGCADAADKLACLQAVPVNDMLDLIDPTSLLLEFDTAFPMPWVDGSFVPQQPAAAYASGAADLPMMLGTTEDEATMFLATSAPLTWFGVPAAIDNFTHDEDLTDAVLDSYSVWDFPIAQDAFLTFATDVMFSCPTRAIADAASGGDPVFVYEFQDKSLTTLALGAHHAIELPYLFGTFAAMAQIPTPGNKALGQGMREAWTSFARTGAPQIDGGWPAYTAGGQVLRLDDSWGPMDDADFRDGRCDELAELGVGGI